MTILVQSHVEVNAVRPEIDLVFTWWRVYNGAQTSQWHFYAMSGDLIVGGGSNTPEPASIALAMGGLGLLSFRRRRAIRR